MSKFLSRHSEGWQCVRDTAFNRLVLDVQANKLKQKKVKTGADLDDEIISEEAFNEYEKSTARDSLTGLYNARHFFSRLAKEVKRAKRYKRPFSLMLISVDKLGQLQKLYGDSVIRQLLQCQAKTISSYVREVDIVFQVSPNQFAVILPETYASKTITVGERICEKSRTKSIKIGTNNIVITVSIGIASFPIHGRQEEELLSIAAQFLEQSENSGGNKVLTS